MSEQAAYDLTTAARRVARLKEAEVPMPSSALEAIGLETKHAGCATFAANLLPSALQTDDFARATASRLTDSAHTDVIVEVNRARREAVFRGDFHFLGVVALGALVARPNELSEAQSSAQDELLHTAVERRLLVGLRPSMPVPYAGAILRYTSLTFEDRYFVASGFDNFTEVPESEQQHIEPLMELLLTRGCHVRGAQMHELIDAAADIRHRFS